MKNPDLKKAEKYDVELYPGKTVIKGVIYLGKTSDSLVVFKIPGTEEFIYAGLGNHLIQREGVITHLNICSAGIVKGTKENLGTERLAELQRLEADLVGGSAIK
jgi:hypothetical protein